MTKPETATVTLEGELKKPEKKFPVNEFLQLLIAVSIIFIGFISFMMYERYACLSEHVERLQKENTELYMLLQADILTEGQNEKLNAYKESLIKRYQGHKAN